MSVSEIAYWFAENILTMAAIIFASIAILLMAGFLIYRAVIGIRSIIKSIKNIRSKRK